MITSHDRQPFDPRLCDEQTVKWVAVNQRQASQCMSVADRDCERLECLSIKHIGKVVG
jgi:hypothetical protein